MKRGPKPKGDHALTGAERQAAYRAHLAEGAAVVRYRRPKDRRGRQQRWRDAVAELTAVQEDCRQWLDTLPAALADGVTAQALRAIIDLNLTELEVVQPPRGYGRD